MFGYHQPVEIILYDIPAQEARLQALVNEALDSSLRQIEDIYIVTDPDLAFKDVDVAIMLDTIGADQFTHKSERIKQCTQVYRRHAESLDKNAKQNIKVIVAGDPININTFILSKYTPSLSKSCFTGLLRMDQNRATFQVSR